MFAPGAGLDDVESAVLRACARGGRLEHACDLLEARLDHLVRVRGTILRQLIYPACLLHLGVFVPALPALFQTGVAEYFRETLVLLFTLYVVGTALFLLMQTLVRLAAHRPAVDAVLCAIPPLGKVRRWFALARFCELYGIQSEAGVNPVDSLAVAAEASRSARIQEAVRGAMSAVRRGESPGDVLDAWVLGGEVMRALQLGSVTGQAPDAMRQLAAEFQERALKRVALIGAALPHAVYLLVAGYVAWRILAFYRGLFENYERLMQF